MSRLICRPEGARVRYGVTLLFAIAACCASSNAFAQGDATTRLLKSGRLPPERIGTVLNLVFQRGGAEDLAYVFSQAVKPDAWPVEIRRQALDGLATAAQTRKVLPEVSLPELGALITEAGKSPSGADAKAAEVRLAALRLAGAWKAASLAPVIAELATNAETSDPLRQAALDSLGLIGGAPAEGVAAKLLATDNPRLRSYGVAAEAGFDQAKAASEAAKILAAPTTSSDNVDLLLGAFLGRQSGSDKLAAAVATVTVPADTAKLVLRQMYLAGRSDPALVDVLSKAAGISTDPPSLTPEDLKKLSAEVLAKGSAPRGEQIFRRGDLGCMKCHAVSGAGGDVGPDLSAVGSTSPTDYVITSILNPDLSIKEVFLTRSFATNDGLIHQGIVVDRDDKRIIIKDGAGARSTIATADVEEEIEGRSLMPKGLAGFLTQPEFFDLVRYVGELGKPGEYAVRSQPTVQRWRYLKTTPKELIEHAPNPAEFEQQVLNAPDESWLPAYAKVAGGLPLDELASGDRKVVFVRGEVAVTEPGEVEIKLDSAEGVTAWIDDRPLAIDALRTSLDAGTHKVTFRVDTRERKHRDLRVVIDKPAGSAVVYTVVGGR